ncbi:MAG: hypothetical protein FE036_02600 [Thermoplasmata archaeon]|nr:MAG: hypothetical protein FE036_02600 [Thermoplasmata archaeon]
MKKIMAVMVAILLLSVIFPQSNAYEKEDDTEGANTTILLFSAVKSNGSGFGYPTGTQFYILLHGGWVIWYYNNGTTTNRYLLQPTTIEGEQIGICYAILGIWKAPRLVSQPGDITANMLVLFGVIIQME